MSRSPKVVLDPDVYDALHFSALAHDGIGTACLYHTRTIDGEVVAVPSCIIGHGLFLDGHVDNANSCGWNETCAKPGHSPVIDELVRAFPALADDIYQPSILGEGKAIDPAQLSEATYLQVIRTIENLNDDTVDAHGRNDSHYDKRMSFLQWARKMHVVRGPEKVAA